MFTGLRDFDNLEKDARNEVKRHLYNDWESSLASKIVNKFDAFNVTDLGMVLGRVILTSDDVPYELFLSTVKGEDGIPQVPLLPREDLLGLEVQCVSLSGFRCRPKEIHS